MAPRAFRGPDTLRRLDAVPARRQPRDEGRPGRPLPLRRRLCQGDFRESHDLQLRVLLLQPGPPGQQPRGGGLGGHGEAGNALLLLLDLQE